MVEYPVARGEILGLLGPNGAGKTTTLRMLATLLRPDRGRGQVAGHDLLNAPERVRASIGYLSASTGLYGRLTAREMLRYLAELQGVADPSRRVEELLDAFDARRFADVPCDRLSTGMKQKINIARAIVHDPPVLVFDEPTAGLDVLVTLELLNWLTEARGRGRTVVYSTHIMGEAERICDRLVVIHRGRVAADGDLATLRRLTGKERPEDVFVSLIERELPRAPR